MDDVDREKQCNGKTDQWTNGLTDRKQVWLWMTREKRGVVWG